MKLPPLQPRTFLGDVLLRNWGLKAIALALAAILFILARDEVVRTYNVPLRALPDPARVLTTTLPEAISVEVRGPWPRVNRLQEWDFGEVLVDLSRAEPGPLEIDARSIVMPRGVVLAAIHYDRVDLRFDQVIERDVPVVPTVVGAVAADYVVARIETRPPRVRVCGGESAVKELNSLGTQALDLAGAEHDVIGSLSLVRPPQGVALLEGQPSTVDVVARVEPVQETRRYDVAVPPDPALDPTGAIPRVYPVEVRGPLPTFRVLEKVGIDVPIEALVVPVLEAGVDGGKVVEVRFAWVQDVPEEVRLALRFDRRLERVALPPAPPPTVPP